MSRTFTAHCSLGDQLEFRSLRGNEQISRLFEYRVRLLSQNPAIDAKSLLGQDMTIEVDLTTEIGGSGKRYMSGQVVQWSSIGRDGNYIAYEAVLRPWLWHASKRSDYKIFQFKTVPQIVEEVLGPYGFTIENKLIGNYRSWDYIVQYGESDFNFVSRLLEMEGAYFFFAHSMGSHRLVLGDDVGSHSPLPNGATSIPYYSGDRAAHVKDEDFIDTWNFAEDIASGYFIADDYDFTKPRAVLDTRQAQPAGHTEDSREVYNWPGGYKDLEDGENYARVRIEQQKAQREVAHGEGNARNIAPGYLCSLQKYPRADQNKEYLIESALYRFEENVRRSDGSGSGSRGGTDSPTTYRISFGVVPKTTAYRSQRITPKPNTTGPQTAVVTGPAGEEIYTDTFGCIKVQFHWDRYGTQDENSSCWIRVSQTWAGSNYGSMHIPRIGQEVIVDFLNGDPDHPIVTGRVYNAMQMPPWDLPANKTQSGIKTNSSKDGAPGAGEKDGAGDANAIRFEDKKGQEQLWLHAQKDQLTEVENDEDKWVGNDRRKTVDGNETNAIHKNRTETVDGNETITVHQNRTRTVDRNEDVTIKQNRTKTVLKNETDEIKKKWDITVGQIRSEKVGLLSNFNVGMVHSENVGLAHSSIVGGKRIEISALDKTEVVTGPRTTTVKSDTLTVEETQKITAKKIEISASEEILLSCGSSSVRLNKELIQILSDLVRINC
ncbi:type VI secretion system secreted protein VgrG [Comamonas sp. BIGb0152]|uniref:type VI secretion system Vgr family protein n=1 Tax=Comamonas sp. BIGb0152 TaxID=2940601 RepID=UPI002167C4C1|nr:type VI secretion system tip protein TssI/VgrG [Comamonas sp. BIGb0152]MCS4292964.1 type VI secretion system secreted protein VgrG [Comamonas sp. BIGb0152]